MIDPGRDALHGTMRFDELQRSLVIPPNRLTRGSIRWSTGWSNSAAGDHPPCVQTAAGTSARVFRSCNRQFPCGPFAIVAFTKAFWGTGVRPYD
jgi:hypothetical protein